MKKQLLSQLTRIFLCFLLMQLLLACGSQATEVGQATPTATPAPPPPVLDYTTAYSMEELVAKTDLIVVGELNKVGEVVNTYRDVNDITKPGTLFYFVGQVYNIKISQYLKGTSPKNIDVIQVEGSIRGTKNILKRKLIRLKPTTPLTLFCLKSSMYFFSS